MFEVMRVNCKSFCVLQLNKKVIEKIALNELEDDSVSIIKHCCDKTKYYVEEVVEKEVNGTLMNVTEQVISCKKKCKCFISLNVRKCTFSHLRQTKTEISLCICAFWSESSLSAHHQNMPIKF